MHFYELPLAFILVGLVLYVVLAGADFGAGLWQLVVRGPRAARIRDHAHNSMAPVWEANHVWLIFVLTVMWTTYPLAFGSIASTLSVALFIAVIGICLRGTAYALRAATSSARELRAIDAVSSVASIIAPFALGAAVGGVASRRVPVGNASGDLFSSWLNPTSILIGTIAVVTAAYLSAVFLSADAVRSGESDLAGDFRVRALAAGAVAGAVSIGGLVVLHSDSHPLYNRLTSGGGGLAGLVVSVLAGVGTFALVWRRRFELARYTAALAVGAIIIGWALAQRPVLLPGLTIKQAAAPHATLVTVVIAVIAGGALLFPSLALLFRLVLGGQLGHGEESVADAASAREILSASRAGLLVRLAGASLLAGIGLLTMADAAWAHAVGVAALFGFIVLGLSAMVPSLADHDDSKSARG